MYVFKLKDGSPQLGYYCVGVFCLDLGVTGRNWEELGVTERNWE